ncbi:MAG TPA: aspartyl protease family protein [Burkholderiaceae bacterium]|jgi:predicted aspartyl protease/Tfp pilus assembly protein PilF
MLPKPASAACKLQTLELPVTMVGLRAVTTLGINGTEVPLIVDSGAFYSFLTHAAAQQLNLRIGSLPYGFRIEGLTGSVDAGLTTVKTVKVGNSEIPNVEFIVGGNAETNGTMGLLGRNFLAIADVEYDLAHGSIKLIFPNDDCSKTMMAYWAGDKPVGELELQDSNRSSKVPAIVGTARLNGKKLDVLFDTGALSSVSLSAAKRAGITDMKPNGRIYGAGRGNAESWTAVADKFELGGEAISNIRMEVADFSDNDFDMMLGIDFFLSHRIYVSKKQHRMYFTYNGGPVFLLSAVERAKAAGHALPAGAANAESAASAAASADEPTDAVGYARRGAASAARLDYAHALADLDHACEMAPQVADYFVRRGAVHEMAGQQELAMRDFSAALRLDALLAEPRLRRAELRAQAKDREGAIQDLQMLDKILAPQASERLRIARLYQHLELHEAALPQWGLWIKSHPKDHELATVYNNRCWARMLLNVELKEALDDCDEAIDRNSDDGSYYDSRAWLRLRRGELRKARSDFDHALELRPKTSWSLYGRGIVRRKQGELAQGQADIEAARQLDKTIDDNAARYGLAADPVASADTAAPPKPPAEAASR